jgi:hypothetical protein
MLAVVIFVVVVVVAGAVIIFGRYNFSLIKTSMKVRLLHMYVPEAAFPGHSIHLDQKILGRYGVHTHKNVN